MSFSRIGSPSNNHSAVCCNKTGSHGFFFAVDQRRSRDGPVPSALLPLLRRSPIVYALGNFEVRSGKLPFESSPTALTPELRDDEQAELIGDVLLFTRSEDRTIHQRIAETKRFIREIQDPYRDAPTVATDIVRSREAFENLWSELRRWFFDDVRTSPAFARISVRLSRTGEMKLAIDQDNVFFTKDARRWHSLGAQGKRKNTDPEPEWGVAAHFLAHQTFFFLRDMAHRHYHHKPHSDMGTVVFPWTPQDDETWRRETHYGLARLAISSRREDDPITYKQSLGVIAYAEAFQSHLAGWVIDPVNGCPVARRNFFPYDFAPLKQSIEASLKVLDFRNAQQVQHLAYVTVTALTTIGLILASGQVFNVSPRLLPEAELPLPTLAGAFWSFISWLVAHPIEVVMFVAFAAILLLTWSQVLKQMDLASRMIAGLTRAGRALLGSWVAQFTNAATAWILASLSGLLVTVLGVVWIGLILIAFFWVIQNGIELSAVFDFIRSRFAPAVP